MTVLSDGLIDSIVEKVIRSEYGGANPETDSTIVLKAENRDRCIWVFVVGKWRPLRFYNGKGIPGKKIQAEVIQRIRVNTGWINNPALATKPIVLTWE